MRFFGSLAFLIVLSGCSLFSQSEGTGISDTQLLFKADLDRGDEPREFTVSVANKGAGVSDVRESVRFPATRYCLERFGGSDVSWAIDTTTEDWAFEENGEALVFAGRCIAR